MPASTLRTALATLAVATGLLSTGCAAEDTAAPAEEKAPVSLGGKADSAFDENGEDLWAAIAARCTPPTEDEKILYSNEFSWGYTPEAMAQKADEIYVSGMRLKDRVYYDAEREVFVMPTASAWGSEIYPSRRIVENVTLHIEKSLERGYAEHIFFPDMGHAHLFIPEAHYQENYADYPVPQLADKYTAMFDDPLLRVLYHTAEQLQMLDDEDKIIDDPWIRWRFHTRNPVGDNDHKGQVDLIHDLTQKVNTARDMEGFHYHGAGFNISASEEGCFPYRHNGETRWYDISQSDLPYQTTGGGGDFY